MKAKGLVVTFVMAAVMAAGGRSMAAPSSSGVYHIVMPGRALAAGESVTLRVEPPAPAGARVMFGIYDGTRGIGFGGSYRAPYVVPPGTPPVRVTAAISGPTIREVTPEVQIELIPSAVPGALDCLGPGQSFSTTGPGLEPQYTPVDELPTPTYKIEPVYPRSQYVRGVTDTVIVQVLLCRTGRVLDAVGVPKYRDTSAPPVYEDPKLVDAAVAAARQWVFSPATAHGVPVACTVVIPMPFRL